MSLGEIEGEEEDKKNTTGNETAVEPNFDVKLGVENGLA